jgi:DNA gyrase subunit A
MAKKQQDNSPENENEIPRATGIISAPIVEEMRKSYLDYAMSVITSRALPDARDGVY